MKLTRKVNKNVNSGKLNEKYKDLPERLRNIILIARKKISKFIRNKKGAGFWRANR